MQHEKRKKGNQEEIGGVMKELEKEPKVMSAEDVRKIWNDPKNMEELDRICRKHGYSKNTCVESLKPWIIDQMVK